MQPILIVDPSQVNLEDLCHPTPKGKIKVVRLSESAYGMLGSFDKMAWLQCLCTAYTSCYLVGPKLKIDWTFQARMLYDQWLLGPDEMPNAVDFQQSEEDKNDSTSQ